MKLEPGSVALESPPPPSLQLTPASHLPICPSSLPIQFRQVEDSWRLHPPLIAPISPKNRQGIHPRLSHACTFTCTYFEVILLKVFADAVQCSAMLPVMEATAIMRQERNCT